MIFSWGMDGTTGQSRYNQADADGVVIDDHSLFTVTLSPLQLKLSCGILIWENNAPQSIQSVRPLIIEFAKENKDYVLNVHNHVKEQIDCLEPFWFEKDSFGVSIDCKFYETMIDGKILNILTGKLGVFL